jgi:hypothetical protein
MENLGNLSALVHPSFESTDFSVDFWAALTGAPPDRPHFDSAIATAVAALSELSKKWPTFQPPQGMLISLLVKPNATNLGDVSEGRLPSNPESWHRDPLFGRSKSHPLYRTLLKVEKIKVVQQANWSVAMAVLGVWLLRNYISNDEPNPGSCNTLINSAKPYGSVALKTLDRMLSRGINALLVASELHPQRAASVGLAAPTTKHQNVSNKNPDHKYRISLKRHFSILQFFPSDTSIQASGGHGTLSSKALKATGLSLKARVQTGETEGIVYCLMALTWLTPELLGKLPIQSDQSSSPAWLDIEKGIFFYNFELVAEKRELSASDPVDLYEKSEQYVAVRLPKFLVAELRQRMKNLTVLLGQRPLVLGDICECGSVNPRSRVVDSQGYRVSIRRIEETVSMVALQAGHHRMPVALATGAFWLISRGRKAYSICTAKRVDAAISAIHQGLGWEKEGIAFPSVAQTNVGSSVCPTREGLVKVMAFLRCRAEEHEINLDEDYLNWMAGLTSFTVSLCLALRDRVAYPIDWTVLFRDDFVQFDDKGVHMDPSEPLPVVFQLKTVLRKWRSAVSQVIQHQMQTYPVPLWVDKIRELSNADGCPLFQVVGSAVVVGAGTATWRDRLPPSLKLVPNFARHYWPHVLMQRNVPQKIVDLLMRHQIDFLPQVGVNVQASLHSQQEVLRAAMEAELAEICAQEERE